MVVPLLPVDNENQRQMIVTQPEFLLLNLAYKALDENQKAKLMSSHVKCADSIQSVPRRFIYNQVAEAINTITQINPQQPQQGQAPNGVKESKKDKLWKLIIKGKDEEECDEELFEEWFNHISDIPEFYGTLKELKELYEIQNN